MKKAFLLMSATLLLASCTTITQTARTVDTRSQVLSATVADLDVAKERVSISYRPTVEERRGGVSNVYHVAERKLLDNKGNGADLLVDPEYTTEQTRFLFWKWISSVTVSGHAATYKNFRSLPDDVWSNAAFRSNYEDGVSKGSSGLMRLFGK